MSFGELVPQIFYDAIARFIAGLTIIGTCMAVWWPNFESLRCLVARGLENAAVTTALVFLIAAYILALLIEGISGFVDKRFNGRRKTAKVGNDQKTDGESHKKDKGSPAHTGIWDRSWEQFVRIFDHQGEKPERPSGAFAIDAVRLMDADVGARIVKLRAEESLCRTLFIGWIVVASVYAATTCVLVLKSYESAPDPIAAAFTLAGLIGACAAIRCRQHSLADRHWTALFNHWILLVHPRVKVIEERRSGAGSTNASTHDDRPAAG